MGSYEIVPNLHCLLVGTGSGLFAIRVRARQGSEYRPWPYACSAEIAIVLLRPYACFGECLSCAGPISSYERGKLLWAVAADDGA